MRERNVPEWLVKTPIAHRGLHNGADIPENSLAAFQAAIQAGLPIEIDVYLLADGQVVVFHDHSLTRLTGAEGKIEEQTAETLRPLRLLGTDQAVPLFAETLREIDGRAPLLIELKTFTPKTGKLEEAVLQELQGYAGPYAVQSFNPMAIYYFRKHAPEVCRGQLSYGKLGVPFARLTHPDFIAYDVEALSDRRTARLRRYGIPLITWTVSKPAQYAVAQLQADNYIFDTTPEFTLPALGQNPGRQ